MKLGLKVLLRCLVMGNKRKPKVSFPGFEQEWKEHKFTEILNRVSKQSNRFDFPKIEFEDIISGEGRLNKDVSKKLDIRKGIEFEPNYILFGKLRPYLKNWLFPDFKGIAVGDFWVFRADNNSPVFGYYLIQSKRFQTVANLSSGTKMPRSDWKTVSNTYFKIPANVEEQARIGNFFKQLDETITLHQQELNNLKQTKQGFLQKMFPKEGESVPELRFPGFTDAWLQCKLSELFSERNERSNVGELISVTIHSGVVKASSLDRKDNSSEDKSNYKRVEIDDIAYNSMRMWQGASGVSNYSGILSPAYTVIVPKKKCLSRFFSYQFKLFRMIQTFQANSQGLTSDTWNLKFPLLKQIKVRTPSLEEQTKIADFFKKIDETITLHQRELEALKQTKKAFLQKMFI